MGYMKKKITKFYTVPELAKALRVHVNTVYKAIKCGRIQAFRAGMGRKASFRINESEIERMMSFDAKILIDKIVEEKVARRGRELGSSQNI